MPEPFCNPYKFRDDTWGVRCSPIPAVGDVLTVVPKSGTRAPWPTQIAEIVSKYDADDVAICRTCAPPRQPKRDRVPKEQERLPIGAKKGPDVQDFDPEENWEDENELPF